MNLNPETISVPVGRLLAVAVLVCSLCFLQACGRKSPLEPPPGYEGTEQSGVQTSGD
ncbi:LPS translocon maturation chaperone LptM [Emcibacter sp.]|uniref:LPS translocon maturation chaperone LptM n=1 Tax=Emcibacter sp. TaxID=1979954 RepID=UPI003A95AF4B